jgi:hypothetical protein
MGNTIQVHCSHQQGHFACSPMTRAGASQPFHDPIRPDNRTVWSNAIGPGARVNREWSASRPRIRIMREGCRQKRYADPRRLSSARWRTLAARDSLAGGAASRRGLDQAASSWLLGFALLRAFRCWQVRSRHEMTCPLIGISSRLLLPFPEFLRSSYSLTRLDALRGDSKGLRSQRR